MVHWLGVLSSTVSTTNTRRSIAVATPSGADVLPLRFDEVRRRHAVQGKEYARFPTRIIYYSFMILPLDRWARRVARAQGHGCGAYGLIWWQYTSTSHCVFSVSRLCLNRTHS